MPPKTDIPVTDSADKLLQRNQLLSDWLTDCLLPSKLKLQVWTPNWVESLRTGHRKADSKYIKEGYKLLTKQLDNNKLQLQYSTDDNEKNDRVSALLLLLLAVHVYRETATECHRDQLFELQAEQWEEHATCVMTTVPTIAYLNQLHQLVDEASKKKPIDSTIDRALLKIHQHSLKFCFKQLLDELSNTTKESCLPPDKKFSAYEFYIQTICMAHVYITQLSTLSSTETEHLPNLLLEQLTKLIKKTSALDLSPSWMECLKQWIQLCLSKLQSLYKETSSTEKTSSALRVISERLRKSTKKMVRKKKLPFPESIREHCWMYFSLHEKLITEWWDKEQHALEYQSTALALFESFMSTFDWPSTFEKGIVNENPLKTFRSAKRTFDWFTRFKEEILHGNSLNSYHSAKQAASLEQWEHLVGPALNKLSDDFFIKDWFGYHDYPNKGSFLHWLVSRHELRLMVKIKNYASTEEKDFQEDEIPSFDKRELYRLVQKTYEELCADLNQITQMILSVWLQKIGLSVSHNDVSNILSIPGRWLYHKNQFPVGQEENAISKLRVYLFDAIEHLGAGVYFFPSFQQRWSAFQEALAAHSGSTADFVHKRHDNKIAPIFIKLFSIVHPDRAFPFKSDWTSESVNDLAKSYIPRIQSIKHDLQKFKERDSSELQNSDAEIEAELLLKWLKDAVLDYMQYHLRSEGWVVNALTLSSDELQQQYSQEICEYVSETEQIDADIIKARGREKEDRKEKEAVQAENERLKVLLAKLQPAVAEEPLVQPQPTIAGSRGALFHVPTTSKASTVATENPILLEHSYAP